MVASIKELHRCELGERTYHFRTPTVYDLPRMRRSLSRQGVRRPHTIEFRVAALAGIEALGEAAGEAEEAARQKAVIEEWYDLLEPLGEDDLDEPDFEKRAVELAARLAERAEARARIYPQVAAIEANLSRHWSPYRELEADRQYWDDVSAIELVRLLLVGDGTAVLPRDGDDLVPETAYRALPPEDLEPLAAFAAQLLAPTGAERKN